MYFKLESVLNTCILTESILDTDFIHNFNLKSIWKTDHLNAAFLIENLFNHKGDYFPKNTFNLNDLS